MASSLSHVKYNRALQLEAGVSDGADRFMASLYLATIIFGLPGNVMALLYFNRECARGDVSSSLYRLIAAMDICTCIAHFPVMAVLYTERHPALFQIYGFCIGWRVVFKTLQRASLFLVMLLSISRTIMIVSPFVQLRKRTFMGVMGILLGFLVVEECIFGPFEEYVYMDVDAYCYEASQNGSTFTKIHDIMYTVELAVPSAIVFFSFIIAVIVMKARSNRSNRTHQPTRRIKLRATQTIIIFTAVFILCNLPHCINMTLWNISQYHFREYPGQFFGNVFMEYYAWNISAILMVVVNATLNPVVYYWRIEEFRQWLRYGMASRPVLRAIKKRKYDCNAKVPSVVIDRQTQRSANTYTSQL